MLFLLFEAKKLSRNCSLQKTPTRMDNAAQSHPLGEGNLVTLPKIVISTTYNKQPTLKLKKKPIF